MESIRKICKTWKSRPEKEGAGVPLFRAFGNREAPHLDPFLLLDDIHSDKPEEYSLGFPRHPHRGIVTLTYLLSGSIRHEDSLDNKLWIREGEILWMITGKGIIHQEIPKKEGTFRCIQIWINLPAVDKMISPKVHLIRVKSIPEIFLNNKTKVRIISGKVNGNKGPLFTPYLSMECLDIHLLPGALFLYPIPSGNRVFAYLEQGSGYFDPEKKQLISEKQMVLFDEGEYVQIEAVDSPLRFLLISGKPIGEPIAWRGSIVMNNEDELRTAFHDYAGGTFGQ